MLRQALTIALTTALLLLVAILTMQHFGWWPGSSVSSTTAPAPTPSPQESPTSVPAAPLSPEQNTAEQTQPAPAPSVPSVVVPPSSRAQPVPAAPTPQVSVSPTSVKPSPTQQKNMLLALNAVRALAQLPAVKEEPTWQAECEAHANYLVTSDTGSHSEDPQSPHYTAAGAACAHGHYYVTMRPEATVAQAITYWRSGPFHLPQLLDPRLTRAALAVKHDAAGDLRTAVVLDVKRGRSGKARYPVRFPAPGQTTASLPLAQNEYPDALPGCPGYTHPAGAPVALLLGEGKTAQAVALTANGKGLESCLLTDQTFQGASAGDTQTGRSVLAAQGVAVAVPRRPLPAGAKINVTFKTASGPVQWSFRTRRP